MVCAGSAEIQNCGTFAEHAANFAKRATIRRTRHIFAAKDAAILGLRHFTRRHTEVRPSKCGALFVEEKQHCMPLCFQVPPRHVCYIIFDVYRRCTRTYCSYLPIRDTAIQENLQDSDHLLEGRTLLVVCIPTLQHTRVDCVRAILRGMEEEKEEEGRRRGGGGEEGEEEEVDEEEEEGRRRGGGGEEEGRKRRRRREGGGGGGGERGRRGTEQ